MASESSFSAYALYDRVTKEIVSAIEAGAASFEMPWHRGSGVGIPINAATRARYRGINTLTLWSVGTRKEYASSFWGTYRQWQSLSAHVRAGERGSPIVYYKMEDDETVPHDMEGKNRKTTYLIRSSYVFNESQVDGWNSEPRRSDRTDRLQNVDSFINRLGAKVNHGGIVAAYDPVHDLIRMPDRDRFISTKSRSATEAFYSVLLHEHVHWTGHESRLNRDLSGRFGKDVYAMEELIAELGAAFLCAELAITVEPRQDHAAYVANWLSVLKNDSTAIAKAAKAATQAADHLSMLATRSPVTT